MLLMPHSTPFVRAPYIPGRCLRDIEIEILFPTRRNTSRQHTNIFDCRHKWIVFPAFPRMGMVSIHSLRALRYSFRMAAALTISIYISIDRLPHMRFYRTSYGIQQADGRCKPKLQFATYAFLAIIAVFLKTIPIIVIYILFRAAIWACYITHFAPSAIKIVMHNTHQNIINTTTSH